jgi:multidrug resistance efflux pump
MTTRRLVIAVIVLLVAVLGLGLYVWHLTRRARQMAPVAADARPISPPVAGSPARITLFLASDDDGTLRKYDATIALPPEPAKQAREVLRALVARYQEPASTHPLNAGADIEDVYLVHDKLVVVDANAAFADTHRSGMLVENLTLASMAQTLTANLPGVTQMKLLIAGKERATLAGHADLSQLYDVTNAAKLVK